MGAIACDRFRFPQSDLYMDEGEEITIKLSLTNCGSDGQGNFFYKIKIDGSDCDTKYNELLYPGENASETLRCDVTMGTSVIEIEQIGGHYNYDTGTWDEDFRYEHKLKPRACQTTCETACQTGCEVSCELTCELSCQSTCEVYCKSQCEMGCQAGCLTACQVGCETYCEGLCQTTCELSCQTSCELGCETGCEVSCETGCEVGCETTCEISCETSEEVPPTKGIIESISCTATKEAEEDYEITAVVTVKNTDTVNHKYRIKMYDSEGTHLDDEPDELDPKPEVAPGGTIDIALTTIGSIPNAKTPEILCELYDIKIGADEFIVSETKQCSEVNIGEITNISCFYNKQGETEYEIEAIVEFKNPDTVTHYYKVELLDGLTKESKDWEPDRIYAGKEVGAETSSAITVNTTGLGYCSSPLILIKLWEVGIIAGINDRIVDEQEYDCTDEESIWKTIADLLGLTVPQVKALATVGGGLLALSFILPLLKR